MDEALTPAKAATATVLALLFAAGAHAQAQGQALRDPTRPPAAAALSSGAGQASPSSGPRLQSILVAREAGGRRLAVIDGETVRPGEQFHGARVARIGDNEVELVRGGERQVLRLYAQEVSGVTPVHAHATAQTTAQATAQLRRREPEKRTN
jgi:MSHA biogenesis protein MshK